MHMRLMTAAERAREIGIRMATGARLLDIQLQFLAEALLLAGGGNIRDFILGYAAGVSCALLT